jgi:Cu-Zn family superoxide dismutase
MRILALIGAVALALPGAALAQQATPLTAIATFIDAQGVEIGTATLTQTAEGVTITGTVNGIPAGEHGFHVHAIGDCTTANKFEAAGGHFTPTGHMHGLENPAGPHEGDIVNQTADAQGVVQLNTVNTMISLEDGPASVFDADGSSLMLHAAPDNNRTDPSGNSGDRIACAVIEAAPAS